MLFASCGPSHLSLNPPADGFGADDYRSVLSAWTRDGEDHHHVMEGRLFVGATYQSPAFRAARLAYAEELFGWDAAARSEANEREDVDTRDWYTFFISVSTGDWRWNHLDRPESIWYVWLEDDAGRKVQASRIERVRRRADYETFYPYFNTFAEGYLVRFPRPGGAEDAKASRSSLPRVEPGSRNFALSIRGAPGSVSLRWGLGR